MKSVKIIALLLALCTLFSLCACGEAAETKKETPTSENATGSPDDIAMTSENFTVTMGEAAYAFALNYNDFKSDDDTIDLYNIDTETSLKEQFYYDDHTWFDEIIDYTEDYLKELLCWCEAAKEAGYELEESDEASIQETLDSWSEHAEDYDYTVNELLEKYLLPGVTLDSMRSFLEKQALSYKYQQKEIYTLTFTDEEYEAYLEESGENIYYVDYYCYEFSEETSDNAKELAEELSEISDPDEFIGYISDYIWETQQLPVDEQNLDDCKKTYIKQDTTEFSEFAFSAEVGDTYVKYLNVDGLYTTYLITKAKYIDETPARTIAYLAAEQASHTDTITATKDYLNGLIEDWQAAGDTSAESFITLAQDKSESSDKETNGCVATNLIPADYSSFSTQLINWLFDAERQVGDVDIVKGNDTQYFAVYYMEEGIASWKCEAEAYMKATKASEIIEELTEKYEVTIDEGVLYEIDA